jgi:hypothetical protein
MLARSPGPPGPGGSNPNWTARAPQIPIAIPMTDNNIKALRITQPESSRDARCANQIDHAARSSHLLKLRSTPWDRAGALLPETISQKGTTSQRSGRILSTKARLEPSAPLMLVSCESKSKTISYSAHRKPQSRGAQGMNSNPGRWPAQRNDSKEGDLGP